MKDWFNRMKPKLKNWRWWVLLPVVLLSLVFVAMPIIAIQKLGEAITKIGDTLYDGFNRDQDWLSRLVEWSEENEE